MMSAVEFEDRSSMRVIFDSVSCRSWEAPNVA